MLIRLIASHFATATNSYATQLDIRKIDEIGRMSWILRLLIGIRISCTIINVSLYGCVYLFMVLNTYKISALSKQ